MAKHAEVLFQTGRWPLPDHKSFGFRRWMVRRSATSPALRTSDGLMRSRLDFLTVAARVGFVELVASALEKLEQRGSLSPEYRCHMIIAAGAGGWSLDPERGDMVEHLLHKWGNSNVAHWGFTFPGELDFGFLQPYTPMMALCCFGFANSHRHQVWESLEWMIRSSAGRTLGDMTTMLLIRLPLLESMDPQPHGKGPVSHSNIWVVRWDGVIYRPELSPKHEYILVEANVAYIFDFQQKALQGRTRSPRAQTALDLAIAEAARHPIQKTAKVWFVADGNENKIYRPVSEAEGTYLLEPLQHPDNSPPSPLEFLGPGPLEFPGLGDRIREVEDRGGLQPYPRDQLQRDLEEARLVVVREDVKDWPPKPYD